MFGSCVTGLRLPHGDVDLMIEAPRALKHEKRVLQRLAQALRDSDVARRVLPLPWASVPILKWTDSATRIRVDACVNRIDALKTTALLARSAAALPSLRPLALVLKSQMRMHQLHETRTGGVGSYLLCHMVRHVLLHPPPPLPPPVDARTARGRTRREAAEWLAVGGDAAALREASAAGAGAREAEALAALAAADAEEEDLGGRLLRFYWYYGYALDTGATVVMGDGEATRVAPAAGAPGHLAHAPQLLSLSDPLQPRSDLGAKAFNWASARRLLRLSYQQLLRRVAIAQTAPDARHVPRWLERRRARARDARGRDQRGEEAHGDDDDDETEASILSAVLPRWQKRWSARDARDAAGRREALALTRREEEAKVADAADALAAEMRELEERAAGGGGRSAASRDPLWSS